MEILDRMFEDAAPAPVKTPTKPAAPPAPAKPRPGTRPWKPNRRPGVSPKPKAKYDDEGERDTDVYIEPRPKACMYRENLGDVPVPPPPSSEEEVDGPEPPAMGDVCDTIRAGDRVTIITPHGNRLIGRATMRNRERGCWVLNLGGSHGTPGIADNKNIVKVSRGGKTIYSKM